MPTIDVLNIRPTIICNLIAKAKEFHAKEEVTIPEKMPESEYEYDWAQILADHYDDLTYREIRSVILSLTHAQQTDLLALLYVGRDDFEDWNSAREAARDNLPENLADYLLAHPLLAEYLEKALGALGFFCEE